MKQNKLNRRKFFTLLGTGAAALAIKPVSVVASGLTQTEAKPATNIADAGKTPRKQTSMPGIFPGKVVVVKDLRWY